MTKQSPPKRGEIWHLDFGPKKTEEYAGKHYAVCLAEKSSKRRVVMFCPLTSKTYNDGSFKILLAGNYINEKDSYALIYQIKSLDWVARKGNFEGTKVKYHVLHYILETLADYVGFKLN